jgi:hypothetical protein
LNIKVLGACCRKSLQTYENTKLAAAALGLDATVENIGDPGEIAKYGVMRLPAIVVDEKAICYGRFLSQKGAEDILRKHLGL